MATQICEPCTIVPCLPEDDFFIPAPPVPPPVPPTRVTVCNTPQTVECPPDKVGYPVTIPACAYSQTLIFQAGTPQATKDALIAQVQANLDAQALAAAQAQLVCHDEPPPPPVTCMTGVTWDAPQIFNSGQPGVAVTCVPTSGPTFLEVTISNFLPAGTLADCFANAHINGRFQYERDADTACQFRVTVEIIASIGMAGQVPESNWQMTICETAFPFECFPNIGYGYNIALGGPEPLGTTNFGPFQSSSFYTGQIDIAIQVNSFFITGGIPIPTDVDTGMTIRLRIEKV